MTIRNSMDTKALPLALYSSQDILKNMFQCEEYIVTNPLVTDGSPNGFDSYLIRCDDINKSGLEIAINKALDAKALRNITEAYLYIYSAQSNQAQSLHYLRVRNGKICTEATAIVAKPNTTINNVIIKLKNILLLPSAKLITGEAINIFIADTNHVRSSNGHLLYQLGVICQEQIKKTTLNKKFVIPICITDSWMAFIIEKNNKQISLQWIEPRGIPVESMWLSLSERVKINFPNSEGFAVTVENILNCQTCPQIELEPDNSGPFLMDALNTIIMGNVLNYAAIYADVIHSDKIRMSLAFGQDVRQSQANNQFICTETPMVNQYKANNIKNTPQIGAEIEDLEVNIRYYPKNIHKADLQCTTTYGDMHGNAMKLLWSFISCGAATMLPEDFDKLWEIYSLNWLDIHRTEARVAITKFNILLEKIIFTPGANVRLLGDIVGDRGKNDYLTLKILACAKANKVNIEILISNHDCGLLRNYTRLNGLMHGSSGERASLEALQILIKKQVITLQEISNLVDTCYFNDQTLKLVSYCLSKDKQKIDIFMHAPNHIDVIYALAEQLQCQKAQIKCENALCMAELIDDINQQFYQKNAEDRILLLASADDAANRKSRNFLPIYPLTMVMYNANSSFFQIPVIKAGGWPQFLGGIFHGHISISAKDILTLYSKIPDYLNLLSVFHNYDNNLGKKPLSTTTPYFIYLSDASTPEVLKKQSLKTTFLRNNIQYSAVVLSDTAKQEPSEAYIDGNVYKIQLSDELKNYLIKNQKSGLNHFRSGPKAYCIPCNQNIDINNDQALIGVIDDYFVKYMIAPELIVFVYVYTNAPLVVRCVRYVSDRSLGEALVVETVSAKSEYNLVDVINEMKTSQNIKAVAESKISQQTSLALGTVLFIEDNDPTCVQDQKIRKQLQIMVSEVTAASCSQGVSLSLNTQEMLYPKKVINNNEVVQQEAKDEHNIAPIL